MTCGFPKFVLMTIVVCAISAAGCGKKGSSTQPMMKPGGGVAAPPAEESAAARRAEEPSNPAAAATSPGFKLTSTAFNDGEPIPKKYSGEGEDISPAFAWEGVPQGTQEFALICDDPDARSREPWVHWVIYGIGPEVRALPENLKSNVSQLTEPIAAKQGENFFDEGNTIGWRGPMPGKGRGTHHYNFRLYALDKPLDVPPSATKKQVVEAMQGHILGEALLIGTYER